MIYEVAAASIIMSMRGLKKFLESAPRGQGWRVLDASLNDLWEGYGHDDEVIIDTNYVKVVGVHLFDSNEEF